MKFLLALLLVACQVPAPAAPQTKATMTPPDAAESTFRIDVGGGSGTAWVVRNDTVSHLITAGHVCEGEFMVVLVGRGGDEHLGRVASVSKTYDLCLVDAYEGLGPALRLATKGPVYYEPVYAVGAPHGVFGCYGGSSLDECGMAPISEGRYAGGNLVSMPMTGGNSGSAVFTADGVIGVLVEAYRGFDSLSFIEPRDHLVEFLDSI